MLSLDLLWQRSNLVEVCVIVFDMDKYYYRLSIGRYLLLIAFGCYLYLHPEQRVKPYQMWMMFGRTGISDCSFQGFDKVSSCLATGRRQRCRLRSIFSRSLFYCSGNFITVRFRDLRGDCSHRLEKLPIISSWIQMVYHHFELGGAIIRRRHGILLSRLTFWLRFRLALDSMSWTTSL